MNEDDQVNMNLIDQMSEYLYDTSLTTVNILLCEFFINFFFLSSSTLIGLVAMSKEKKLDSENEGHLHAYTCSFEHGKVYGHN